MLQILTRFQKRATQTTFLIPKFNFSRKLGNVKNIVGAQEKKKELEEQL